MSIFYTHIRNGDGLTEDNEGQDFAALEDACRNALRAAGEIVAEEMAAGRYQVRLELYIHDASGALLATIPVTANARGL